MGSLMRITLMGMMDSPELMECTLTDSTKAKECSKCCYWGEHFRSGHTAENVVGAKGVQLCGNDPEDDDVVQEATGTTNL